MRSVAVLVGLGLAACVHTGWRTVVEARAAVCTIGHRAVVAGVACRCVDVEVGCRGTPDPDPDDDTDDGGRMVCASVDDDDRDGDTTDAFGCPLRLPVEQGTCTRPATAGSAWGCPFLIDDAVQLWRCVDGHWTAAPEDCRGAM